MSGLARAMASTRNFLRVAEVDAIQALVHELDSWGHITVVDIGAGAGTTALSVLEARSDNLTVYTIDSNHENLDWARMAIRNAGLLEHWVPVYDYSARRFLDRVDILLVDGDHSYEGVKADLAAWLPAVRHMSAVWLDDFNEPGVARAVEEAPLVDIDPIEKSVVCRRA